MADDRDGQTTHFATQEVAEDQRRPGSSMVSSPMSPRNYDIMNVTLMSVGIHRVWKDAMMDWLAPRDASACSTWRAAPAMWPSAFSERAPGASATVLDMTELHADFERPEARRGGPDGRQAGVIVATPCAALRGQQLRPLHDQLRHPQRDPRTSRRALLRSVPRAAPRRPLVVR